MRTLYSLIFLLLLGSLPAPALAADEAAALNWQPFTPALFAEAKRTHKPVFLYLEAVWCHWCHVMQRETFTDAAVQAELQQHWLITRVDHDANPLLANRYRDYGWPALIFFNSEGKEVVKRAGFIAAEPFAQLLSAIVADPTPEQAEAAPAVASVAASAALTAKVRKTLMARHSKNYDTLRGGLRTTQKYLDRDSIEYALALAAAGDRTEGRRVRQTLAAARALIDPVWGGIYQYSTNGDWSHAHFEKIMRAQSKSLAVYAEAYGQLHDAADLASAQAVRNYLLNFLRSPQGAFYVSQDADAVPGEKATTYFELGDAARRAIGLPKTDQHVYAQENGQAIEALATLARTANDAVALEAAITAAQWVKANRANSDGSFKHDAASEGLYLGDTLHMARGFLALYRATHDAAWLGDAKLAAAAITATFRGEGAGYLTASALGAVVEPPRITEENIPAARFFAALAKATGDQAWLSAADHALAWLYQPEVALESFTEPGILLAEKERQQ